VQGFPYPIFYFSISQKTARFVELPGFGLHPAIEFNHGATPDGAVRPMGFLQRLVADLHSILLVTFVVVLFEDLL